MMDNRTCLQLPLIAEHIQSSIIANRLMDRLRIKTGRLFGESHLPVFHLLSPSPTRYASSSAGTRPYK